MTEERDNFFDGLSNKELSIRLGIISAKKRIKDAKFRLNYTECSKDGIRATLNRISWNKNVIEVLKKQLPAPTRFGACVICGCKQPKGHIRFYSYSYCAECGQKLR